MDHSYFVVGECALAHRAEIRGRSAPWQGPVGGHSAVRRKDDHCRPSPRDFCTDPTQLRL